MAKSRWQFLLYVLIAASVDASSSLGKSYDLYQILGSEQKPKPRGKITIAPSDDETISGLVATYHPDAVAQLDIAAFDEMVGRGDLYTLIVTDESSEHKVSASVPGCSVRRANLREEIILSISPTGKLMSVSYRPLISPLAAKTCDNLMPLSDKPDVIFGRSEDDKGMPFKTTVSFESHKPMMEIPTVLPRSRPPPGLNWYRRNSKNNPQMFTEGGGPEGEEPHGFQATFVYKIMTKYWYIILPLAVMSLFGVEEPEGAAQGGGGAAAAVGASGAAGAVRQTQRRGKRD